MAKRTYERRSLYNRTRYPGPLGKLLDRVEKLEAKRYYQRKKKKTFWGW